MYYQLHQDINIQICVNASKKVFKKYWNALEKYFSKKNVAAATRTERFVNFL